jgi:hypothetical protein
MFHVVPFYNTVGLGTDHHLHPTRVVVKLLHLTDTTFATDGKDCPEWLVLQGLVHET